MAEQTSNFFMVWSPSGRAPTYRHESFESARTEAKRLARLNPEQSFFVLVSVGEAVCREPVEWTMHRDLHLEIPF